MLQLGSILLEAAVVALLLRVAVVDFRTQRIANRDVLALAVAGVGTILCRALWRLDQLQTGVWGELYLSLAMAAGLFLVLLPLWLMRKIGAGDVKLMAATPLVAGSSEMLTFAIFLMGFAIVTVFFVKNPMLLPAPMFREYVAHFGRKGVVPFGVPICAALLAVVALRAFAGFG
jgi:prepilin peptidase CpaA